MENGLVTRTTGSWYNVLTPSGKAFNCRLRGGYRLHGNKQTNPIAVGDLVSFALQTDGTGVIHEVADRRNYIVRRATKLSKQTHVIAANIDLLCIVATLASPRTSTGFIDRLLATAEAYHIPACLIFNKSDLLTQADLREAQASMAAIYTTASYPVLQVSAQQGTGLEQLSQAIAGRTILFCGHSGVGKSALLNALAPSLHLRVGDISHWSLKGTHTTTFAEIFPVPLRTAESEATTYLIDTPGIKEFGLVDIAPQELSHFFPEMRPLLPQCRFANCTHTHEPGCAVKEAVANGKISSWRYKNYLNMIDDLTAGE
ncbi:MAG: ribosome small subunit-dependent GTPase A [Bacteroidales bacterium]|nr:ribosome small subunit-dependent GTPase A [Bacteroidales bacterium]